MTAGGVAAIDYRHLFAEAMRLEMEDTFTAHGIGENLGHVLLPENEAVMEVLRAAFAAWYGNGHTNEQDPNTCLLKIRLTDGVLFSNGTRYDIDFT